MVSLAWRNVGLCAALLPTLSSSFNTHSFAQSGRGSLSRKVAQPQRSIHTKNDEVKISRTSAGGGVLALKATSDPQGLWKALGDLSSEIIPPANAMDDPFPGVGLSLDSLYESSSKVVKKAAAQPAAVAKAASEPTRKASEQMSDSMTKASEEMSKASDRFSNAMDSAFAKSSEPVMQATTATSTSTTSAPAASTTEQVVQAAASSSDPVVKAVDPMVQQVASSSSAEPILKSAEPVLQAATPVVKTGGAFTVKPSDAMLKVVERNSELSDSFNHAVHDTVGKIGSAFTFEAPNPPAILGAANKASVMKGTASSMDMTGMFDNIKFNFQVPSVNFQVPSVTSMKFPSEQFTLTPEQMESAKASIAEFGKEYYATLDAYYHITDFQHAVVTGTAANGAIRDVIAFGNDVVDSLDLEHFSGWYVSLITFFWAATQRREGEKYGRLVSERKITQIESQLAKTKEKADKETSKKSSEVEELKEQMEMLKSQVQMLSDAAKDVKQQLEVANANAAAPPAPAPPAEPVKVEEPVQIEEEVTVTSKHTEPAAKTTKTKGAKKGTDKSPAAKKTSKRKTVKVKGTKSEVSSSDKSTSTPKKIVVSSDDWSRLSESTLKRKTVKQLTGYLSEKGMDVTDADGKPLKKDNLVELVLSN